MVIKHLALSEHQVVHEFFRSTNRLGSYSMRHFRSLDQFYYGDIQVQGPHIQIIVDRDPVPLPLQTALQRMGARVSIRSIGKAADAGVSPTADVCVILTRQDQQADLLERVMSHASDLACATMMLPSTTRASAHPAGKPQPAESRVSNMPVHRLASPNTPTNDVLTADEITGRIKALYELRRPLRRMRDELDRLKHPRLHSTVDIRDLDQQLRLAAQVQNDLLPTPLVDSTPLRISTLYLPADYVSGDIYDIVRLDEHSIGFSIADVTGHGLPAALLTFLIKKSLQGKDIYKNNYRVVEPDELLGRLNEDLLRAQLSECQFVTATHAVFDRATCRIRWARGGSPYPILVRPGEKASRLVSEGGLIGAFPQQFELTSAQLLPGDVILLYTDGLDALLLNGSTTNNRGGSVLDSDWVHTLETEGPEAALASVRDQATRSDWPRDDITIIALQVS